MALLELLVELVAIVGTLLVATAFAVVGRPRLAQLARNLRGRLRKVAPSLVLLGVVLLVNRVARQLAPELSWIIGFRITDLIYSIEGTFVAWVQSFATPAATTYFIHVYVHGYVYLLVFPLIAYLALEDLEPLRETILAYTLNYGIGLACYVLFVAYGPRNLMPELVESLLVSGWPQSTQLTSEVNVNTNVFPSLHTSLSVTVALLAYRTRRIYPGWFAISVPLAGSVALATMYLGIHWATDVVAGILLAVGSVWIATRVQLPQDRDELRDRATGLRSRVRRTLGRTRQTLRRGWSRRRSR